MRRYLFGMQLPLPVVGMERAAAILEAVILAALAALCLHLYRRYRKPYFAWFAAAWGMYVLRMWAILSFLTTARPGWLYWHQVFTGWTALALLWAALVFVRQPRWRHAYFLVALFPPVWSYIAIYRLDHFVWAALPAVLFLSFATLATGWVFFRHFDRVGGTGAGLLAGSFLLWGIHHLDYLILRAQGAWNPWGYYLDIFFELAVGTGILLLVLDDLRRGLGALGALSGDLQRAGREDQDVVAALLERPLALPAVSGTALYARTEAGVRCVRGAGACSSWPPTPPPELAARLAQAMDSGRPQLGPAPARRGRDHLYEAVLPVFRGTEASGALVLTGNARDPFAALDERFLVTLGQQVGAGLANADLTRRLHARTVELARLSARMVEQHEEERRRLSRELHDETAQVFSAVKMELGVLRDGVPPEAAGRIDHALSLVDTGIRGIRSVVHSLRPSLLDDLGLLPALRSLITEFTERSGLAVTLEAPGAVAALSKDAELALFRALQEALSNVARHAEAKSIAVSIRQDGSTLTLTVQDDGRGLPEGITPATIERPGHMGITGMRERIGALGGTVTVEAPEGDGVKILVAVPLAGARSPTKD
ncbi:MAG TPA: GAF domain-containing sensor histidine kinase [Gemmatimonadales bacterium]|nr:GAF domain-containing sensor histidine kinase [Gemmatimonadales bacterium]